MDGMGETNIDKKKQAVKTDATGRRSGFLLRMPFFRCEQLNFAGTVALSVKICLQCLDGWIHFTQ